MPVRLGNHLGKEAEARIEIVPLIDIMFFLLASFMLVSLSMVNLKSMHVDLPTATAASAETSDDLINLSVDRGGLVFLDKQALGSNELQDRLKALYLENKDLRVFISGDREARHGDIIHVLDMVRLAGIEEVGFEISSGSGDAD